MNDHNGVPNELPFVVVGRRVSQVIALFGADYVAEKSDCQSSDEAGSDWVELVLVDVEEADGEEGDSGGEEDAGQDIPVDALDS